MTVETPPVVRKRQALPTVNSEAPDTRTPAPCLEATMADLYKQYARETEDGGRRMAPKRHTKESEYEIPDYEPRSPVSSGPTQGALGSPKVGLGFAAATG